jgi:hypothetical protein
VWHPIRGPDAPRPVRSSSDRRANHNRSILHRAVEWRPPALALSSLPSEGSPPRASAGLADDELAGRETIRCIVQQRPTHSAYAPLIPLPPNKTADFARLERDLDALLAAYRRGDAEAFLARDGYDRQSETFDIIIRQRNRSWLPQVEALLAGSAPAFVAVGVSHLIGPDSVVELLRDGGHEVWRLAQ